jgi:iron-sulfur cluster insertion protein
MKEAIRSTRMTSSASYKILELMQEEENLELMLRVFIQGGGCSGFKYGFSFELQKNIDDYNYVTNIVKFVYKEHYYHNIIKLYALYQLVLELKPDISSMLVNSIINDLSAVLGLNSNKVTLLVDPISIQYLRNAVIDYKSGIEGEYFTVINPDAKTTCGCGSSFAIDTSSAVKAT